MVDTQEGQELPVGDPAQPTLTVSIAPEGVGEPDPGADDEDLACTLPTAYIKDADIEIGTTIRRYQIVRLLGIGGMGRVFLAFDIQLNRLVALKFLTNITTRRSRRFAAEARALAQIFHKYVVAIYDIDTYHGVPYMALEYIDGQTLEQWLSSRANPNHTPPRLPLDRITDIILPVIRALVAAHECGIVHCDLKPGNIMLGRDGTVKVLDFGTAKILSAPSMTITEHASEPIRLPSSPTRCHGSQSGSDHPVLGDSETINRSRILVNGTPRYMSPEQWNGDDVDPTTDIWAVGVILFELLTDTHPLAPQGGAPSMAALKTVADLKASIVSVRERLRERDIAAGDNIAGDNIAGDNIAGDGGASPHRVPQCDTAEGTAAYLALADMVDGCLCKNKHERVSATELLTELEQLHKACAETPAASAHRDEHAHRWLWPTVAVFFAATTVLLATIYGIPGI